ncbi:Sulfurtransferase TusE [Thiorhodovibrio litoralis]|nr:Sulfurtransferase TusE [Thiorhodovibrio litoralis]
MLRVTQLAALEYDKKLTGRRPAGAFASGNNDKRIIDMAIEVNGTSIETTDNGFLVTYTDWNEDVARKLAEIEGIELTEQHWDVINYLRDEYINNNQNQPMERVLLKDMGKKWGSKPSSKDVYKLFPLAPTKQGTKIAGLPAVMRKGGY